jgi:ferredoxin
MVVSIIPLLYFVPIEQVWRLFTFQEVSDAAYSIRWIYMVFVFIAFVNYAVVRQYVCRYMCIYRMWQYLFKTRETLHIDYDESRSEDCEKCNYCETQCMVGIDPKSTNMFDSCTNCGACISACNAMHAKKGQPGLLSFRMGERRNKFHSNAMIRLASFKERFAWVFPAWLIGASLFAWGLWSYNPYHVAVYQSEISHGDQVFEYRANIASKLFEPGHIDISVDGLDQTAYNISATHVEFESAGRQDIFIHLNKNLSPGIYNFILRASANNGWEDFVRVSHVVTGGNNE